MMTDERGPHSPHHMKHGGSPEHVTVNRTVTTSTTEPMFNIDWIQFNKEYFKSIPGIIKLTALALGILCMILGSPALANLKGTDFFLFVVVISFMMTLIWTFIYLLSVRENLEAKIPWLLMEFSTTAFSAVFYFLAMVVEFATVSGHPYLGAYVAAGVFALFNTIVYAAAAFIAYREWKGLPIIMTTTTIPANNTNVA